MRIALPAIASNVTVPLLGLVDVAITGHLGSAAYIGAIALGSTMFNMLYWLFGFLRMGTAGITAQAYGAGDSRESSAVLEWSLLIALGAGLAIIALCSPLATLVLKFLDGDDSVTPLARLYFTITVWGAPAVLVTYVFNGWFLGKQDTRTPLWVAIGTNLVNIAVSCTLVMGFGMKIEGVAIGTLTAQWLSAIVSATAAWLRYSPQPVSLRALRSPRRLLQVNADIFVRTLFMVAVTVWFTRTGASQGVIVLSANALLLQLFMFFSYFSDGLAYAGEALTGKTVGQRAGVDRLSHLQETLLNWGLDMALVFTSIYFVAGEWILQLLTDNGDVVTAAKEYLPWAVSIPICGIGAFMYDGMFIGLTHTRHMLGAVAVASLLYFGLYLYLFPQLGNHGLWIAFLAYLAARGIYLWAAMRHIKHKWPYTG